MTSVAPVCPISRDQPIPGLPLVTIPAIPQVTSLPAAIAALNQLNAIIAQLGPGLPQNNFPHVPQIPTGSPAQQGSSKFQVHWTEESRETELVDICNPDGDPKTEFVTVPRIVGVTFASRQTAIIKLVWSLRR
jgi:hypothetical protein